MSDTLRRLAFGLAVALLVLALWWLHAFDLLQVKAADLGAALRPTPGTSDVVVVGIDNESLDELGQLPWPRRRYAKAIRELSKAGAESIALDMWFAESATDPTEDEVLRDAAREAGNVFVALYVAQEESLVKVTRSHEKLVRGAMQEAHVNVIRDSDWGVRRAPWEVHTLAERFLFMPVALAAHHFKVKLEDVTAERNAFRIGPNRIPLEPQADGSAAFLLDLPDTPSAVNHIPFKDIVNGKFDPRQVRGKIVLIGQVIVGGSFADTWITAHGRKFGVIMLSEITQQLLHGRRLIAVPRFWTLLLVVVLAVCGAFLCYPRHAQLGIGAHLLLLGIVWTFFLFWMTRYGLIFEPAPLTAALVASLTVGMVRSLRSAGNELIQDARAMEILHQLSETLVSSAGMPTIVTGKRMDVSQSFVLPGQTPQVLLQTIAQAVGGQHGGLFISRQNRPGMVRIASLGGEEEAPPPELSDLVNQRLLQAGRAFASSNPSRDLGLARAALPRTLLAMPLSFKDQIMGAIHLYGKRPTEASPEERFTPADLRLVAIMAQQTLIGLENASLYEGMRGIFMSATLALANAVDAKDPYTRGHSERVLNYSEQLARAMSLPVQDIESIKMAAVLHDIGKIAIPDEILRKPGRLTDSEFDLIRTHPARGEAILAPLEELRPLRPGIRHHHERYDGKGYPDRLAGQEIPLHARIICVADSFDAMTSKRYYHEAMNAEEGLKEISRCGGSQFDPDIAACFIKAFSRRAPVPVLPQAVLLAMAK